MYRKNITALYFIKIAKWFNLVMPVVVLFYQDNGMGMQEIFILKSIYSVAIVAMEIPSGWMADAWGRKKTLLLGSILGCGGFLVYSFSYGFYAFAVAEIILGVGYSFVSGADSALLFDSLKADNRAGKYTRDEGRMTSAGNFAEAIAGVAGGFLATISLRTPFFVQFVVAAIAIPASLALTEPKLHVAQHIHSLKKLVITLKNNLSQNQQLRISILLSSATGTATLTFAWLVQPFFKEVNLPVEWFGIFWTILNLTAGISSVSAHRIEGFLGQKRTIWMSIILLTAGYFLSGMFIYFQGIAFLFLFYFVRGIATPVLKNYMNEHTESEVRATMLSVRNFVIRIVFAVVGPLLGWITDNISLDGAFYTAGLIYLVSSLAVVLPFRKRTPSK